jgi:predicted ester cyclase
MPIQVTNRAKLCDEPIGSGCSTAKNPSLETGKGGTTMEDLESLARRALALLDERRMDEWEATMAPDVSFSAPGMALRGRAQIRQFVEGFQQAFPDVHHRIDHVFASGDTLVYEGAFTGTHTGVLRTPGGDVPPTHRRIEMPEVQIVTIIHGLAASMRTYFDRLDMLTQLGVLAPPAARKEAL